LRSHWITIGKGSSFGVERIVDHSTALAAVEWIQIGATDTRKDVRIFVWMTLSVSRWNVNLLSKIIFVLFICLLRLSVYKGLAKFGKHLFAQQVLEWFDSTRNECVSVTFVEFGSQKLVRFNID